MSENFWPTLYASHKSLTLQSQHEKAIKSYQKIFHSTHNHVFLSHLVPHGNFLVQERQVLLATIASSWRAFCPRKVSNLVKCTTLNFFNSKRWVQESKVHSSPIFFFSWIPMKLVIPLHIISLKKTPNDAVTPQRQSQFTPKMKANALLRLVSSLVWIDQ